MPPEHPADGPVPRARPRDFAKAPNREGPLGATTGWAYRKEAVS